MALTHKDRMLAGELYDASDPQLVQERREARELMRQFNASRDEQRQRRAEILRKLLGAAGESTWIEPPFFCDYGYNIFLAENVYMNFNCVILDPARVEIGPNTLLGPNVQIYTATHPLDATVRRTGLEFARPVTVGPDVWIGGAAILCPGISIGAASVIGAGSVVTRDIPAHVFAAGNPCRVIRPIGPETRRI